MYAISNAMIHNKTGQYLTNYDFQFEKYIHMYTMIFYFRF